MVVENSAQWKMLERTEKKTLSGHKALELTEAAATPEPGTVVLFLLGICAWLCKLFHPGLLSMKKLHFPW
jgi:hypothetical protein